MASVQRIAAPKAEWVLMYRGGLTRTRIAALTGAPASTIGYHLAVARAEDPGLAAAHEEAVAGKTPRVSAHGLERMQELLAMVQETDSIHPCGPRRRQNGARGSGWRRRREATEGTLAAEYREGLGVLPGWQGAPRAATDEARWQDRLAALVTYRAAGHDCPRHKATVTGEEHDLGVWLHAQRYKHRRSELDPAKAQAPDESVPGWRTGRQRGRKPQAGAGPLGGYGGKARTFGAGRPCFPSAKEALRGQRRRCRCQFFLRFTVVVVPRALTL